MSEGSIGKRAAALAWVPGVTWVTMACAGGAPAGGEARAAGGETAPAGGAPCEVGRVPLTLADGAYPYIDPEDLLRVGSGFLVVGSPSYTFGPGPDGVNVQLTADRHLATRFTLDGSATLIEKPIPGAIGSVRALSLGGERWGVLFDEADPDSLPGRLHLLGLWYAEHDGQEWATLQRVPLPDAGRLDLSPSSELVRIGDDFVWIAATHLPDGTSRVVQYERRGGEWSHAVISDDWIEVSTLAYDPGSGLWMAHFSEDRAFTEWRQSLRLYRRTVDWELVRRITVLEPGVKLQDPAITVGPDGISVSWRLWGRDDLAAQAMVGIRATGGGTAVTLDPSALQLWALRPSIGGPRWLVTHVDGSGQSSERRLRMLSAPAPPGVEVVDRPSPYPAGYFAAYPLSPSEALVVGPDLSLVPANSYLRSLILRLSTSCN